MSISTKRARRIRWVLVLVPAVVAMVAIYVLSFHPGNGEGPRPLAVAIYDQAIVIVVAMVIANLYEALRAYLREHRR